MDMFSEKWNNGGQKTGCFRVEMSNLAKIIAFLCWINMLQ